MYFVYILRSKSTKKHYVGTTFNLEKRLIAHNSGANISTKNGRPWDIIYSEKYETKTEAWRRERQIKSYKGGRAFKALIESIS